MKKLLKKKVNVFGKGIPVFAIVLLGLALVSAALVPYFGKITGLVTLSQSVLFDGEDIDDVPTITEDMTGVAGEIFRKDDHNLENNADTWILVDVALVSTCPPDGGTDCAGFTVYPEFKLVPTNDGIWDQNIGDEDDVHFYFGDKAWSEFTDVSFNYNITAGLSERVPHVNAWLRSGDEEIQITTWKGGSPDPTLLDGTATYEKSKFVKINGESVASGYETWTIREVRIQSGNPGADPSDASDLQTVYVSNVEVNDVAIGNIIELPTSDYANVPGRVVDFRMVYDFAYNVYPGTYTTTTTVDYTGIISESGVTITDTGP